MTEPVAVHPVAVGQLIEQFALFCADGLDFFSGNPGINKPTFTDHILRNQCPGADNGIWLNNSMIHYNGPHSDQDMILKGASVHDGPVTNADKIPDLRPDLSISILNESQ